MQRYRIMSLSGPKVRKMSTPDPHKMSGTPLQLSSHRRSHEF
jgi:hypothetical protein